MVVAVYGSPRKGGNTDILMDEYLESVMGNQEIKRFYLRNLQLKPCIACGGCNKTGICIFKDDIWSIYEHIERANGLVLSSPIYFGSMSSQLKTFVDRAQPFWVRKYLLGQKNRNTTKAFFISVGAINTNKYFENAKLIEKIHLKIMDIEYTGELFFPGIDEKGAIKNVPGALQQAHEAGVEFLSLLI